MSDKLQESFDIYYLELENFTGHFRTSSQKVETDKMLSKVGKFGKIEELKASHLKNVSPITPRAHHLPVNEQASRGEVSQRSLPF